MRDVIIITGCKVTARMVEENRRDWGKRGELRERQGYFGNKDEEEEAAAAAMAMFDWSIDSSFVNSALLRVNVCAVYWLQLITGSRYVRFVCLSISDFVYGTAYSNARTFSPCIFFIQLITSTDNHLLSFIFFKATIGQYIYNYIIIKINLYQF